jgi:hypothetical protein
VSYELLLCDLEEHQVFNRFYPCFSSVSASVLKEGYEDYIKYSKGETVFPLPPEGSYFLFSVVEYPILFLSTASEVSVSSHL